MEKFIWEQDTYRYVLGTVGKKPLIFIGLNPSTAIPKHPDQTYFRLTKLLKTSLTKFDSIILLNLCPFISTKLDNLSNETEGYHAKRNIYFITQILAELNDKNKELNILLGWGSGVKKLQYFKDALSALELILENYKSSTNFYYIESKNEHYPLHPLAFPKGIELQPKTLLPENYFKF